MFFKSFFLFSFLFSNFIKKKMVVVRYLCIYGFFKGLYIVSVCWCLNEELFFGL